MKYTQFAAKYSPHIVAQSYQIKWIKYAMPVASIALLAGVAIKMSWLCHEYKNSSKFKLWGQDASLKAHATAKGEINTVAGGYKT